MVHHDPIRSRILAVAQAAEDLASSVQALLTVYDVGDHPDAVHVPGQGVWTRDMLDRLVTAAFDNGPIEFERGLLALLDAGAAKAGDWVTFSQVLAVSGLDSATQRNIHAKITRTSRALFGRRTWPVEAKQEASRPTKSTAEMTYRMPARIAAWWGEIRSHDDFATGHR